MKSDKEYFEMARAVALLSPDTSRKTGCVLTNSGDGFFYEIEACNCFPQGVEVTAARLSRPHKYTFTEHAERNAIYSAARHGSTTRGATMYLPWYPCADCARAIVQADIAELVCVEPDWNEERYGFRDAEAILKEGGVKVRYGQESKEN